MDNNKEIGKEEESPHLSIIQKIKDGTLSPKALTPDLRKRCVRVLRDDGYTTSQIAQIFDITDRQIRRDVEQINRENALSPNIEFAKESVGGMVSKALTHHDYLVRLSNGKDISPAEKIQARVAAWQVIKGLVEKLQSLGYLPLKPQEMISDIYYHQDNAIKSLEELKGELSAIEKVAQESGSLDDDTKGQIKLIQQKLEQAQIAQEIKDLADKNNNKQEDSKTEEQNG